MKIFWNNAISDNFSNTTDWSTGAVPGPADTAVMTVPGTYTISSTANQTVLGINTGSNTTLTIDNNSNFTATEGTAIGANRGSVQVNAGSNFQIGGIFDNIGTIDLLATNVAGVALNIIGPTGATLTGGGTIVMADVPLGGGNFIQGGPTLTNINNTISGAGNIGGGSPLDFINEKLGVVDATGTNNPLTIDTTTTNLGLLEATGSAGLVIASVVNNTSGVIQAGDNSLVSLYYAIEGGTLRTVGNGVLTVPSGVNLSGRINIDGAIDVGTTNQAASIGVGFSPKSSPLNLTGHGSIVLSDNGGNSIIAPSDLGLQYLNNAVPISGAGVIGGRNLNLKNQTTGLIDATGINPLIIDTGQNAVSNFGTLEASTGSTLFVVSKLTNNGTLQAVDGLVAVQGAVSGTGGGTINGTGQIEFGASSNNRVRFAAGSTGELILDNSKQYIGTIFGFRREHHSVD